MSLNFTRPISAAARVAALSIAVSALATQSALSQVLIGSPFITGFEGWQSTYTTQPTQVGVPPNWSVLLTPDPFSGQRFLMESSDGREADSTVAADGKYKPYILINTLDTTPANYTLDYQLATVDNDGFGLVFGYQDNNNYFRVGFREQAANLGFGRGTSVQKVVGGVITQIAAPSTAFVPTSAGTPFQAKVVVNGPNWDIQVAPTVGGTFSSILSGSDSDLQPGKYGMHSWANREVSSTASPQYGSIFGPVSVSSTTLNKTTDFANAVSSIPWRRLVMVNQFGETGFESPPGTGNSNDDHGNFAQDFLHGTIFDDSNGNVNATTGAANIDFMGPAIVVDSAGAADMTNYRYSVRVENRDNDGIGLLYRVDAANNFYRINWNTEGPAIVGGTGVTRPPLGMSIQKYKDGLWSEIYRDAQTFPTDPSIFKPTDGRPFDVSIQAIGNQFKIDVLDDPNGSPTAWSYGVIADNSGDPILAGSVGFTNWGNGDADNGAVYSAHNGDSTSLVTALSTILDLKLTVDRDSGNVKLVNSSASPSNIRGVTILSQGATLNQANWLSIADNYDEAPQNGSVDMDDPWTELSITDFNLSEREISIGGNGGTLTAGQMVNLGDIWRKSQIEDLVLSIELANGDVVVGNVSYIEGPNDMSYSRSDLNADGSVNAADWGIFFPNMLTNISALPGYNRAIKGDLDLDGDNDVFDFVAFKADYDLANGAGAFNDMLGSVPEPSSVMLVLLTITAVCASRSKRRAKSIAFGLSLTTLVSMTGTAEAVPLDLTTFGTEVYPRAASFLAPVWATTPTTASLGNNADATVLYTPSNVVNKRITGTLTPGSDDDVVGFVVGFEPGDSAIGSSADYFLIDWKGATQAFDFDDLATPPIFHNLTGSATMPAGLALSRVTGSANDDELWRHVDYAASPTGAVAELARGNTLGATPYDRTGGSHLFEFSITDHEVIVKVGGVEQFAFGGTFAPGRFGLYSAWQGPTATFSDFDEVNYPGDIPILRATVDRSNGNITLDNPFSASVLFDFYQFSSASNSLDTVAWNSLHDQNFQPAGVTDPQKWQKAGGSSNSAIAEVYVDGNSTLTGTTTHTIGAAYNNLINGQDLVFQYRLVTGELRTGYVNYIGVAPVPGDYNGDSKVNAADYVLWRKNPGAYGGDPAGYNTWRANVGSLGSGSSLDEGSVPEPTAVALLTCLGVFVATGRRRTSV